MYQLKSRRFIRKKIEIIKIQKKGRIMDFRFRDGSKNDGEDMVAEIWY